jgi:hypothetical protein
MKSFSAAGNDNTAGKESSIPSAIMLCDNLQCLLYVQQLIWAAFTGWRAIVFLLLHSTCEHHILLSRGAFQ